jgi:hypothetical protein
VSLPHAHCHSIAGLHVFIKVELEDEGELEMLSASLQADMASYMRSHKSKLYSWMEKTDYLKKINFFPSRNRD